MNIKTSKQAPTDAVNIIFTTNKFTTLASESNQRKLEIGLGKKKFSTRTMITSFRIMIRKSREYELRSLAIDRKTIEFFGLDHEEKELASLLCQNSIMAEFESNKYKSNNKNEQTELTIFGDLSNDFKLGIAKGIAIGEEVNKCRELSNTPGGEITPTKLADWAKNSLKGLNIKVSILDKKKIENLKMGAILGVSKGSSEDPRFIIMDYKGGGKEQPIVLVGKGVTFDTGGLSLKPADSMLGMHLDMSGGAAVIHTLALAAKLKIKRNVVGLVPAVENMPSGQSYRPGDILVSMSGKTIEVINTDAEGRLILADALEYAKRYNPLLVVDVATLTGAAVVALGERSSAIFSKDKKLTDIIEDIGERSGDYVWPLPLWDEYSEDIKGTFGDVANLHNQGSRYGGAIHAAAFLYEFAKDYPWVHIDMAPRMTAIPSDHLTKGSIGTPVRLLIKLLEEFDLKV